MANKTLSALVVTLGVAAATSGGVKVSFRVDNIKLEQPIAFED